MTTWLTSAVCLVLLQTGCSQETKWSAVNRLIDAQFEDVPRVTTDSLAERLEASGSNANNRPRPVLLDARGPNEFAVSHLSGAHRVDPRAKTFPALDTLDRDTPIVVYCSVGYRSAGVTQTLREQGFTNVSNLKGSIFRWANEGRTVVRDGAPVRAVHPYDETWGALLNRELWAYDAEEGTPDPGAGS